MECIALYALAASGSNPGLLSSAVQLLGPLAAAGGCSGVRQAAVRGLVDIALLFGPAAVDSVLRAPAAAVQLGEVSGGDEDGVSGDDEGAEEAAEACAGKGLLELLLGQAGELLAALQAPNGAKTARKGGRWVLLQTALPAQAASPLTVLLLVH